MSSKIERVLEHLKAGKSITPRQAIEKFNAYRLADIVYKLKTRGFPILTEVLREGDATFACYTMVKRTSA